MPRPLAYTSCCSKTFLPRSSLAQVVGPVDRQVESIAYDSRRVQKNGLFVALRGEKNDGHQFIDQAIEKGASVIVAERGCQQTRATCVQVENSAQRARGSGAPLFTIVRRAG